MTRPDKKLRGIQCTANEKCKTLDSFFSPSCSTAVVLETQAHDLLVSSYSFPSLRINLAYW